MRKLLGGLVLVAGVGGLGWYASQGPARAMEEQIAQAAADVAGTAIHGVSASVSGRDITLSGTVDSTAEQDTLLAALDAIPGRRVVNADGIEVLPVASPFLLSMTKDQAGVAVAGNAPSERIAEELGFSGLNIASGAPDGWQDAVSSVLAAIETLDTAQVAVSDTNIAISGLAKTPAEEAALDTALSELPPGYMVLTDIETLDDGTPLRLSLSFDGTTLTGSGKIPSDMPVDDVVIADSERQLTLQEGALASADGNWPEAAQAGIAALAALGSGDLMLEGQTGSLTAESTPDGIAAAEAALAELPEGYKIATDLSLFDDGAPFALTVEKTADALTVAGKVPADFEGRDGLDGMTTAFITDESGVWPGIADAGLAALDALETGNLAIADNTVTLTGNALTPAERDTAITALDGYEATTDIALLDDGTPPSLTLVYDTETGAAVSGKLPSAIGPTDVAEALDLEVADDGVTASVLSSDVDFIGPLSALQRFLPEVTGLTYVANGTDISVDAAAAPGVDPAQLGAAMQDALGDTATLNVRPAADLPVAGTTRVNRFSGREEVFTDGYWLPTFEFFPTPEACSEQSEIILASDSVQFVTGSADLDVQSIRAINAISALARKCAVEGGVFLRVAGHTDNTGDAAANLALSEARANAVRDAILQRGLARAVVSAIGYGDTQPIADNETEEGRAANRRTEFIWNFE